MSEAEPLQQIRRTYVRQYGRTYSYFGGCDYFRLASHPKVHAALRDGLRRYGLNVAASRTTSGNHQVYLELEKALAHFFTTETALLTSTGYGTNLIAAQALAGQFSHALIDERAHAALKDAAEVLNCPVLQFKHRDAEDFARALERCGKGARPIVLTDGMFSRDGAVAPLRTYLKVLPPDGLLLVDDAHGAGTLGKSGRGSIELEAIPRQRVIQCVTLSKALGVYGGAILCSHKLRARLTNSRAFIGSTPLPLPLAVAATTSLHILQQDKKLRLRLNENAASVKTALGLAGLELPNFPGPIIPLHFNAPEQSAKVKRALLHAKVLPPLINYPGAPTNGYFRFVISSEHTAKQLENLVRTLTPFLKHATT
jgi:8-amino-7-oxononanoate synthase